MTSIIAKKKRDKDTWATMTTMPPQDNQVATADKPVIVWKRTPTKTVTHLTREQAKEDKPIEEEIGVMKKALMTSELIVMNRTVDQ